MPLLLTFHFVTDPHLMVSFVMVGFVLASNPDLLAELINKIVNSISDPALATTLKIR